MSSPKYSDGDLRRAVGIVNEQIDDKLQVILEVVSGMQRHVAQIPNILERLEVVEDGIATVKVALTSTNHDLRVIKKRTEKLEQFADEVTDHGVRIDLLEQAHQK